MSVLPRSPSCRDVREGVHCIPTAAISVFQAFKYRKSSIKPIGGSYLFQAHLRRGLIETGGGLLLEKTMVSVLHKELEYKVEKLKYKKVGSHVVSLPPHKRLLNQR